MLDLTVSVLQRNRPSPFPRWLLSRLESRILGAEASKPIMGHLGYWICQLAAWGGLWLLTCVAFFGDPQPRIESSPFHSLLLINQTTCCLCGLVFTHFFRVLYHLRNWRSLRWSILAPRVAVSCLIFAVIVAFINNIIAFYFAGTSWDLSMALSGPVIFGIIQNVLTLVSWTALYLGYQCHRELQEERINRILLDSELKEAQLQRLRSQINPHFFFNSLNTIRAVAGISADLTRDAVTQLAELTRASLESSAEKVVSFREELRIVKAYVSLERLRHFDQINVESAIDESLLDASVPPLICQTLVENAIKHGTYRNDPPSIVRYTLTGDQNSVCFKVINPGSLKATGSTNGTGLANARRRLQLLYGRTASLSLQMIDPGEVVAELLLPRSVAE